jgi:hypothetical protein
LLTRTRASSRTAFTARCSIRDGRPMMAFTQAVSFSFGPPSGETLRNPPKNYPSKAVFSPGCRIRCFASLSSGVQRLCNGSRAVEK